MKRHLIYRVVRDLRKSKQEKSYFKTSLFAYINYVTQYMHGGKHFKSPLIFQIAIQKWFYNKGIFVQ